MRKRAGYVANFDHDTALSNEEDRRRKCCMPSRARMLSILVGFLELMVALGFYIGFVVPTSVVLFVGPAFVVSRRFAVAALDPSVGVVAWEAALPS
jgi:hypothetical protein